MGASDVPSELWLDVFELLERPSDLKNVSLTCRWFWSLALRHLHTNLVWSHSDDHLEDPFWKLEDGDVKLVPRTLTVVDHGNPSIPMTSKYQMHKHMASVVTSFINLHTITLQNMYMPNPILPVLYRLPGLQTLRVAGFFHSQTAIARPHLLPVPPPRLRDLEFYSHREPGHINEIFIQHLGLLVQPSLRSLRLAWTLSIARFFLGQSEIPCNFPHELETFTTVLPQEKAWKEDGSGIQHLRSPLEQFLRKCTHLKHLTIHGHLPALSAPGLTPQLLTYSGPLACAPSLTHDTKVQKITLTSAENSLNSITSYMDTLPSTTPKLQELHLELHHWDIEIMYAMVILVPQLSAFSVYYVYGSPDDNAIVSFGPQFFIRMPNLEVAHICPAPHLGDPNTKSSYTVDQEDIYDLLIGWKRWCPKLREIQLTQDSVWRRASVEDRWTKRAPAESKPVSPLGQYADIADSWT